MNVSDWPSQKWFPFLLFLVAWGIYSINTQGLMLYALDEAKNAGCAREMYQSEEWIVPMFNGQLRTDKPPLHYYHMMLSFRVFGVNPFAARFFSGIYGALTVLLVFLFSKKHLGIKAAVWSVAALLASIHMAFQFHFAVPDPYLIFFLTLAGFCFFEAYQNPKLKYLIGLYLGVALGTLAKGPVAIGLPGLIFLVFLLTQRQVNWQTLRPLKPFLGAIFVVILVLPWYLLVWQATNGQWVKDFLFTHNLNRYAETMESHRSFFVLPIIFPLVGMLPLGVFLPQAIRTAWKQKESITSFTLVAIACFVVFFMFSRTYLPNYTAPAYPYLAILIGNYLAKTTVHSRLKIGYLLLMIISIIVPVGGYIALKNDPALHSIATQVVWFFPLVVGTALGIYFLKKGTINKAHIAVAFGGIATIIGIYLGFYPKMDALNPVAQTLPKMDTRRPMVYFQRMNPAYIFNLDKKVPGMQTVKELTSYLDQNPGAYIITRTRYRKELSTIPGLVEVMSAKDILEIPTTLILEYNPEVIPE